MISKIMFELVEDTKYKRVKWEKSFLSNRYRQVYKCLWNGERITLITHLNNPGCYYGHIYINNVYIADTSDLVGLIREEELLIREQKEEKKKELALINLYRKITDTK